MVTLSPVTLTVKTSVKDEYKYYLASPVQIKKHSLELEMKVRQRLKEKKVNLRWRETLPKKKKKKIVEGQIKKRKKKVVVVVG